MLRGSTSEELEQLEFFGVAIVMSAPQQAHSAILYRREDGSPWLLHLAWNYRLCDGPAAPPFQWVQVLLDTSSKKLLAVLAEQIRTAQPHIPWAFDAEGIGFDVDTGGLIAGEEGTGLTCATLITTLLKTHALFLLAEEEWPPDANKDWQERMLAQMRDPRWGASDAHIAKMENDAGRVRRFAPEEVAGSATYSPWPVGFAKAQVLADNIRSEIQPYSQQIDC